MNKYKIFFLSILLPFIFRMGHACESRFNLSIEPETVISPLSRLKIGLYLPVIDKVPFSLRQRIILAPGDYYRYPRGAKRVEIDDISKRDILNYLLGLIKGDNYDSCILDNLTGLIYSFKGDNITRSEFFSAIPWQIQLT